MLKLQLPTHVPSRLKFLQERHWSGPEPQHPESEHSGSHTWPSATAHKRMMFGDCLFLWQQYSLFSIILKRLVYIKVCSAQRIPKDKMVHLYYRQVYSVSPHHTLPAAGYWWVGLFELCGLWTAWSSSQCGGNRGCYSDWCTHCRHWSHGESAGPVR